jgi:raffinose/stachyose/melibiose transport system permease protein
MKSKIVNTVKYLLLFLFTSFVFIVPLWIVIINSLKPAKEAITIGLGFPKQLNFIENYKTVIVEGHLLRGFLNTLLLTVCSVTLIIIFGSMVSWVIARKKTKYISVLYYILISGILIAPAIISSIRVLKVLHLYGSYLGLILFYTGVIMPLIIFFTTGFIKTIPLELEEAARIDGATPAGIFFRIIFPLLRPVRMTSIVFVTLSVWNDFIYPFYFTNTSDKQTMTLGLYYFISNFYMQVRWELIFTDCVLVSLPLIVVYIFAQRNIVSGIMVGAIKG